MTQKPEPFESPIHGYPPRPFHFIHHNAEVDPTVTIGEGVKIWANACVMYDTVLGRDVSIGRGTEIGHGTTIGDGTRIGYGCFVPNNAKIGRDVFIGPSCTFCDDMHPRTRKPWEPPYHAQPCVIEDGAAIGAMVTLLPGVHIGKGARIAAGSIVTRDVRDYTAVRGQGGAKEFTPPKEWDPAASDDKTEAQYRARMSAL